MNAVQADKRTLRQQLEALAQRPNLSRGSAKLLEQLESPPYPDVLEYLWKWFVDLSRSREIFYAPDGTPVKMRLKYSDLFMWSHLTRKEIRPYEVDALFLIDSIYLNPDIED